MHGRDLEPPRPSMFWRSILVIALTVVFYVVVLSCVALLVAALWNKVRAGEGELIHLLILFMATMVMYAVLPRFDNHTPSGPRITPADQPRLFALIAEVAAATGQSMPDEVYVDWDVNAAVWQRGAWLGLGGTRALVVGLPLLQVLNCSQLRGFLAHEFGHYHQWDTRLASWVHRAARGVGRTLQALTQSVLGLPFLLFGVPFLRLTRAIAREQELVADALAVATVGHGALRSALEQLDVAVVAAQGFWMIEVLPCLEAGRRPSITEGFASYLEAPDVQAELATVRRQWLDDATTAPFDTHPATPERVAAIDALPRTPPRIRPAAADEQSARTLLDGLDGLERSILAAIGGVAGGASLQPIDWSDIGEAVYLPMYRREIQEATTLLAGVTPAGLPAHPDVPETAERMPAHAGRMHGAEQRVRSTLRGQLATAILLALLQAGWRLDVQVGCPIRCRRGEQVLEPFTLVEDLAHGMLKPAAYLDQVRDAGIADVDLGGLVDPTGAQP